MRKDITLQLFLAIAIVITIFTIGCKKMGDMHSQFVKDGETVYVAKADSIVARSGRDRVELSWLLLSDPKVRSYKVYWDSLTDSLEGPVVKTDGVDTVRVIVDNLAEGIHYFEVYMFGKDGSQSVQTTAIGNAYGANYQESLLPRIIENANWEAGNSILLELTNATDGDLHMEIEYVNRVTGSVKKSFISSEMEEDVLLNVKDVNGEAILKYRSAFLPDSNAIDTFYSEYNTIKVIKTGLEVDKNGFSILPLDNDVWQSHYSSRTPSLIWDGSVESSPYATLSSSFPSSFSIDLGKQVDLTKFRWNDYQGGNNYAYFYNRGTPVNFEVWGSNNPSQNGDWADWVKLGTYEIKKPSGLPAGATFTQEDIDYGLAGYEFSFDRTNETNYRYVRFKVLDVWQGKDPYHVWIGELTFWAFP